MILKELKLKNFRAYKNITIPFNKGINVIIGRNDVGKSTILEAIDIFLGQSKTKIDINDRNVHVKDDISISMVFEVDDKKEYLIDTDVKTNLKDEYLLNKQGDLEIVKKWDCSKEKLTASSLKTYIKAFYPKELSQKPLPIMKIEDLRKFLENTINEDIVMDLSDHLSNNNFTGLNIGLYNSGEDKKIPIDIDMRKRADIRALIYRTFENLEFSEQLIPIDKEDCKNIYSSLEKDFPQFELFQSDRENKDSEKDVQDPLKVITRKVIKEQQTMLDKITKELENRVEELSKQTLEKLKEMNSELASELTAELHSRDWASLFNYSFTSDSGIPLNKRGSGVRRLVLLNFFRAEAENKSTSSHNIIYALEEPETSQHADHQIMIMKAFKEIAKEDNRQVILTTHSNNLIKMVEPDEIIFIKKEGSEHKVINDENINIEIAKDLGTLPNLNSSVVVIVEGITDKLFLENINNTIPDYKNIIDLKKEQIPIFWVGGSNIENWVDSRPLFSQNIVEFHLYDSDGKDHYLSQINKINNWENGSFAKQTSLPTIENYIHPDIVYQAKDEEHIRSYFSKNVTNILNNIRDKWNEDTWNNLKTNWKSTKNISTKIENLGLSKSKKYINDYLVNLMTKELLEDLGVFDEIKGWFEKIKELNDKYNKKK